MTQVVDTNVWVTNGNVRAVVRDGGTIYLGGLFSMVGPATGGGVPIEVGAGLPAAGFPQVQGTVVAAVSDGLGGWFIGGNFLSVGGVARACLAHILSDQTVSSWNPSANGPVLCLAVSGSTVYVGGAFTSVGGQPRSRIAALDLSTGLATAWDPNPNGDVNALAVSGSTVYAAGSFETIGGQPRSFLAALDGLTGAATAWNPNADFRVESIVVSGSNVYVGGGFSNIGGQPRNSVAALSASTALATSWDPNANGTVNALAVNGSVVYAGGTFTTIGGAARNRIAALDASTALATAWNPAANDEVKTLMHTGSTVYAGGLFTTIGGATRNRIVALDASTGLATTWNPSANLVVRVIAPDAFAARVYAGGDFTSLGAVTRNNIAALDAATGAATSWNPDADGGVNSLAVLGSTIYAAGAFGSIGGQSRAAFAALDAATGGATPWNPNADGNADVITISGSTAYVGGGFTTVGGQARSRVAALDLTTGAATSWDPSADENVFEIEVSGSTVYACGLFTSIGGQPRNRIAALDLSTGLATAWNPNANNSVSDVEVSGGIVYAGGLFTSIGGQARNRIAALDAATGLATPWNPNAGNQVQVLELDGPTLYAGGKFTSIGGQPRQHIAAIDVTNGLVTPWDPNAAFTVTTLDVHGTTLYAGGGFVTMGGLRQSFIAAVSTAPALTSVVPASGGNAGPVTVTLYGSGLPGGTTVKLARPGQSDISGTGVLVAGNGRSLEATFDLPGASTGSWDIVVTAPDLQSATLVNGFTVEGIEGAQLRVGIVGTSLVGGNPAVRRDRRTAFDLVIENPGNVDALSVPLWLAGVPLDATLELGFALAYPPQSVGEPDWTSVPQFFTSASAKYVPIVIPRVPPGTTTRRIYLTVPGPTHPPFQLIAAVAPPWMDGNVFRSCLSPAGGIANPTCMGGQLDAINSHLTANPNLDGLSGVAWWAKVAWQCEGAGTLSAALVKAEQVLDFMAQAVEIGSAAAGCENVIQPRWRDVQTVTVVGSIDPNDKLGLQGSFSGQTVLPYSIRFENFSSATVPAQDVIVTDQLDGNVLELSTLSLGQITFGNRHIFPPPGLSSYSTTVDLRPQKNLLVNVSASLDPVTHVVSWYFNSIDPVTGRTPTDFQMGFLPPNVAPPEGEGSVMFTVMPKSGLSTGTQISNAAAILFDDPPATNTPAWTNGVDNSPPASHVLPLSGQSNQPSIPVSWVSDAPSDLRDFTIFVKQDTGPYRVWRLNTPTTSDTLVPPPDHQHHTFSFYSVARDQLGNIEAPPPVADASTQSTTAVEGTAVPELVLAGARPNPARGSIDVWLTLPSRERATLELLDVAGRRIARREVGQLGPGAHLVALEPPRGAGLYFLKLTQSHRVLHARVVVLP